MQNHTQHFDFAVVLTMTDSAAAAADHSEPVSTCQKKKKKLKVITNETIPALSFKILGSVINVFKRDNDIYNIISNELCSLYYIFKTH